MTVLRRLQWFQQGLSEQTGRRLKRRKWRRWFGSCVCSAAGVSIIHMLKVLRGEKQSSNRQSNHGSIWRNFISRWESRPSFQCCSGPRPGLPPQTHHRDGDGISDVCCRRTPLPAAVTGGDWSIPVCGLGLPVYRADVCCDGAGVDPHSEREAQAETVQLGDMNRRWK